MKSKRQIVSAPVFLAILALAIHAILVPPMAVGSGWAALCSPDGSQRLILTGDPPAPGGLGDCDDCPVCPAAHEIIPSERSVASAFGPLHGERSPDNWGQSDTDLPTTVTLVPVGQRAPPIA